MLSRQNGQKKKILLRPAAASSRGGQLGFGCHRSGCPRRTWHRSMSPAQNCLTAAMKIYFYPGGGRGWSFKIPKRKMSHRPTGAARCPSCAAGLVAFSGWGCQKPLETAHCLSQYWPVSLKTQRYVIPYIQPRCTTLHQGEFEQFRFLAASSALKTLHSHDFWFFLPAEVLGTQAGSSRKRTRELGAQAETRSCQNRAAPETQKKSLHAGLNRPG